MIHSSNHTEGSMISLMMTKYKPKHFANKVSNKSETNKGRFITVL
jgi:hypothetical protein